MRNQRHACLERDQRNNNHSILCAVFLGQQRPHYPQ